MVKNIFLDGLVLSALFLLTMNSFSDGSSTKNVDLNRDTELAEPFVVLELFTSQGCSSCPPADALLEKVKSEYPENVLTLSYHVDYWNYIGWEDPFSNSSYVQRQSAYNIKFNNRSNYTPQIVVNGMEHFVGSDSQKMKMAVNSYLNTEVNNSLNLNKVKRKQGKISFEYEISGSLDQKKLRAVLVLDKRVTKVKRGENRSRTLSNTNIVVSERFVDINESKGLASLDVPKIVESNEKLHLILLLENIDNDIVGAAKKEIAN